MSLARTIVGARRALSGGVGVARALAAARSGRAHPIVDGRMQLSGIDAAVTIERDRFGVAHIWGHSEADAVFGQGVVHAQDRLFQLDLWRRAALGRLAEVAGPSVLGSDRLMRRFGLARRARLDVAAASDEEGELLTAYACGLNAGMRTLPALPPEYALLGGQPKLWRPEDSLVIARLLMLGFATNWDAELERDEVLSAIGPERLALVDGVYPEEARTVTGAPYRGAAKRLLEAYDSVRALGAAVGGASNAWAVAGRHTASGAPLLACDPHLRASVPGFFHVAHLAGGDLDVIGAGIAGVPGVLIGHNHDVAWGITAGLADVSDCYIEELDPADPARYRTPTGWERGHIRLERIAVRDGATVEEHVLETRHGPVIGPALPGEQRAISLRSTALEDGEMLRPLLALNRAPNAAAADSALREWSGATFNFVFADRTGAIGYRLGGSIPERGRGEGLLPQDGASSEGAQPRRPAAELPSLLDPPEGVVVSANNAPSDDLGLGEEWAEPYRAERIAALLAAHDGHTVASMQAIQHDLHSAALIELRDLVVDREILDDTDVRALITDWDGQASAESAPAAFLESLYIELARVLVERIVGEAAPLVLGRGRGSQLAESRFHYRLQGQLIDALVHARAPWLDGVEDRDRLLRASCTRVLAVLRERLGADLQRWRWGDLHTQRLRHPLEAVPVVGRAFSRGPYAVGGDVNTVWQGGFTVESGPASGSGYSPAYRQVLDLDRWDRSTFQLASGNSGIPGHPRYDDCVTEFLEGRQRPLLFSREAVQRQIEHTLTLEPATS